MNKIAGLGICDGCSHCVREPDFDADNPPAFCREVHVAEYWAALSEREDKYGTHPLIDLAEHEFDPVAGVPLDEDEGDSGPGGLMPEQCIWRSPPGVFKWIEYPPNKGWHLVLESNLRQPSPSERGLIGNDGRGGALICIGRQGTEDYWTFRVKLSEKQAILGFRKFEMIGIGFLEENEDTNRNLPASDDPEIIFNHIKANKGDPKISDEQCIAAIMFVQQATRKLYADNVESIRDRHMQGLVRWWIQMLDAVATGKPARSVPPPPDHFAYGT